MPRRRVQHHKPVWEMRTSAATPPSLLFSIASTTNLVGHNIFTSFAYRDTNIYFQRTSMATEQVAVQFRQIQDSFLHTQEGFILRDRLVIAPVTLATPQPKIPPGFTSVVQRRNTKLVGGRKPATRYSRRWT